MRIAFNRDSFRLKLSSDHSIQLKFSLKKGGNIMTLYLAAFALPSANSSHTHHHHSDDCGCGEHEQEEKAHECCGGANHDADHECCGGKGHDEPLAHGGDESCTGGHHDEHEVPGQDEEPSTGFDAFAEEVGKLYPDHLPLFPSLWLINSDKTHQEVYASLKHTVDSHSALWIIPLPKDSAGFLKPDALDWIKPRLYPAKKK